MELPNELQSLIAHHMFDGDICPGCGHIWNSEDDLVHARSRVSNKMEAWHDECIRKFHPELFESEATDDDRNR